MAKVVTIKNDTSGRWIEAVVIASGDAAGGSLAGAFPNPTLSVLGSSGSCTNCDLSISTEGRVTAYANGSSGSPQITGLTNSTGGTIADRAAVNAFYNSATNKVRKADSSTSNDFPVMGFAVGSIANSATTGIIQTAGLLSGFGAAIGASDFGLAFYSDPATPGGITTTATNTAGEKQQYVGYGAGAGVLMIEIREPVEQI